MPAMAALAFKTRVGLTPWASRPQRARASHPVRANVLQRRSVFTTPLIMLARWLADWNRCLSTATGRLAPTVPMPGPPRGAPFRRKATPSQIGENLLGQGRGVGQNLALGRNLET
eukprot:4012505-Pyramimonas_sp.AAC.1